MGFAVRVYEAFKEDEVKAKVLAEFVEKVEEAISNNQVATRQDLSLQELKLTKEMKEIELRLTKEIEQVRAELRLEIERVRVEIQQVKGSILKWLIGLLLTQTITIIGIIVGLFQVLR
ncbi:MAG: hypothetical protein N3F66_11955 [Spirochaetes bacterium]|nr:hypothetical protein [Spirochaetota bacterium]